MIHHRIQHAPIGKSVSRRVGHRAAGFTLAELVIVCSLIGLIVMSSATIMWQVSGARERVDRRDRLNADADAAIRAIGTCIANTYRTPGNEQIVFVGEDEQVSGFDTDTLRLQCVSHKAVRPGQPESDVRLVEFMLTDSPDKSSTVLARRTDPTHNVPDDQGGVVDIIASNIVSLNFEYFDGMLWQVDWSESLGRAPSAVRVTVAMADPQRPKAIIASTRTIALPWMPDNTTQTDNSQPMEVIRE